MIGVGHVLRYSTDAEPLSFVNRDTGAIATTAEVRKAYETIAAQPAGRPATYYGALSNLRLPDAEIDNLLKADIQPFLQNLAKALPKWDTYPQPAQAALFDIAWTDGVASFARKYSMLIAAADARDWESCAQNSSRKDIPDARNRIRAALFRQAAK